MRVFMTGASGWIGSAVVPELLAAGHEVVGLARSDASAEAVAALGAEVWRGDLEDADALRAAAEGADGVIHLAFIHDFSNYGHSLEVDQRAIEAFGAALSGSDRPLLIAGGLLGLGGDHVATEREMHDPAMPRQPRPRRHSRLRTKACARWSCGSRRPFTARATRGSSRCSPASLRQRGVSGYVGDGTSHWPAVHRSDAAHLVCLAFEHAPAGSILHAGAEEGVQSRAIAEAIGRSLDLPVVSVEADRAVEHFGWIGPIFSLDARASNVLTHELLDWDPTGPGLIEDIDAGHYSRT